MIVVLISGKLFITPLYIYIRGTFLYCKGKKQK